MKEEEYIKDKIIDTQKAVIKKIQDNVSEYTNGTKISVKETDKNGEAFLINYLQSQMIKMRYIYL